ncbi:MAG: M16 family metallopeptidase, partial [Chitinophagaceae bacterium]
MTSLHRNIAPPIQDAVDFSLQLPPYERIQLANGVEVFLVNMGAEDTLQISWVFGAGNWYETAKGTAAVTNYLLKNGTSGKTAFAINEYFDFYGAYLNRSCFTEFADMTLHCLSRHAGELLPVVAELLTDSRFPETEWNIYRQNALQRLQVNVKNCDFVASRLIDAQVFGREHPYGRYMEAADYERLTPEQFQQFYDQYYVQGNCVIFVAGKIPSSLPKQLEESFGSLPIQSHRQDRKGPMVVMQPDPNKRVQLINDENGVQAAIRLARPFPDRHHPDYQPVLLLNTIFGGYFGSRLMANIREDKGYTYGIYSYLQNHIRETAWTISAEVGREVAAATLHEIHAEMKRLREELLGPEELKMARNYLMGT